MTAAVVPVKTLAASKTRLFPDLEHAAVERLTLAMMTDVVAALQRVRALTRIAVVTPDTAVARAAEAAGVEALLRPDPGLNAAVERAAAELCGAQGDGLLVVLGDVAAVAPADLETLIGAAGTPGVALAPSRDGGTSALLRTPCRQIALPSLAIDIDVADDAAEILRTATLGPHTREALGALGMSAP